MCIISLIHHKFNSMKCSILFIIICVTSFDVKTKILSDTETVTPNISKCTVKSTNIY